jgi:peptidoglycan/xylan/chitin deacetylase (PgdA/CDA1 family)/CelD/BcsL family acetyltransferase involved in cellulose biosynthesis
MKVVEVREEAGLRQLREEWGRLVCESASRTIFLTWEWAEAWWSAYGTAGDLRIMTVSDDNGVLRGIAPLRCQTVKRYGQAVQALSFVGDGSIGSALNDSDYLDFIVSRGYERPVMEALYKHWEELLIRGGALLLNEIPETSPNLTALKEVTESRGMHWGETEVPCATVRLPQTWEDYQRTLQPRFRTKLRSVLRNLENRPEVRFRFCDDPQELDRMLPVLFDLHARRWEREGKPGVFGWDRKCDFYFELSRLLLDRQWLRLSCLEWNGQVLACQYGFAYNGTYSQLQEGYEPAAEHWSPGIGLRAWSIREFLREGLREYDFLGGVSRHKTDWGAEIKKSKRILLAGRSYKTLLFRRGAEWETAARESIRTIIPEKMLEARSALLQGKRDINGEWSRRAVARCYFHSGLPTLMRGVRDRYQLSITANGYGPKVSWKRRKEGGARILYYHRVNDDNDPFFDALPPGQFEEQIRHLARHYKVASLPEIMRHLEEGTSPETLIGITFDDGYQDNYHNAFPILRRYGVPATIFLTTGSLDSREPLWFELLAEAVKKTLRQFIDLEIDIPRRFWMRTQPERLQTNAELFRLLRVLDDAARRERLREILRQLGNVGEGARNDKLLTWDQIRLMKAHGIDFGGHTVTHPFLSRLLPSQAAWEVSECKRRVEAELQQPVYYFAYPNGREEDLGPFNKEVLRSAGYRAAMTTIWGVNHPTTDRMEMRRGGPWETNPALFASKLDWYHLANQ